MTERCEPDRRDRSASRLTGLVRALDQFQQEHRPLAFLVAVVKKFGDDRCRNLGALLAYYGFVSLFPLLLLLITVLGLVAGGNASLTHSIERSALSQFPVVGNKLGASIHELHRRSAVGLAVGIIGLVPGSQGVTQTGQFATAEVWNIPVVKRPGFATRLGRSLATLAAVGGFLLITTTLAGVATFGSHGAGPAVGGAVVSVVVNAAMFAVVFRLLTPRQVEWRSMIPGSAVAGVGWTVLQYFGTAVVDHMLRNTSQVYGFFAVVLGLLAWIYLAAQLTLYAAEVNVVASRRLWPRALKQPPFTPADHAVLNAVAAEGKRRPGQDLEVRFAGSRADSEPASRA